jgi:hypothetical protein
MIGCIFYFTTGLHGIHVLFGCFGWLVILSLVSFPSFSLVHSLLTLPFRLNYLLPDLIYSFNWSSDTILYSTFPILYSSHSYIFPSFDLTLLSLSYSPIPSSIPRSSFLYLFCFTSNPNFFIEFSSSILLCSYYWHFVDWIWLVVFLVLFLEQLLLEHR